MFFLDVTLFSLAVRKISWASQGFFMGVTMFSWMSRHFHWASQSFHGRRKVFMGVTIFSWMSRYFHWVSQNYHGRHKTFMDVTQFSLAVTKFDWISCWITYRHKRWSVVTINYKWSHEITQDQLLSENSNVDNALWTWSFFSIESLALTLILGLSHFQLSNMPRVASEFGT